MEPYHHENSRKLYEEYYTKQVGGALPFFVGTRYQRGHGLGNILKVVTRLAAPLLRKANPFVKRGAKALGRRALQTSADIIGDVLDGENIKRATKRRIRNTVQNMTGSGTAKRPRLNRPKPPGESIKRKRHRHLRVSVQKKRSKRRHKDALGN